MPSQLDHIEIVLTDPNGQSKSMNLPLGTYVLGREDDCDIRFPPAAKMVSRHHARLLVEPDRVQLEDLESHCGTRVNGQVVRRQELQDDDVMGLANYFVRIRFPAKEGAEGPPESGGTAIVVGENGADAREVQNLDADLLAVSAATHRLNREIAKRIVGQESIVRAVWAAILANAHCLMIGVPGLAKTYMVTTFADALGLQFQRIQFTPDLMPSDIIGSNVIQESEDGRRTFEFVQGPIFTQLLLADEINRTPPKTQAALLEAMQERQVTVANRSLSLASPFCVIASQNPIEQEGTYPLPEAQQDRFMLCLVLDYPNRDEEIDILKRTTHGGEVEVEAVLDYQEILRFQKIVDDISVPAEVATYAADLVRASRPGRPESLPWINEMLDWGAGPRAGQSLLRSAKALAAMDGRPAVSHGDLRELAIPVMRHRILCNYRARTEGYTEETIIKRLLEEVKES